MAERTADLLKGIVARAADAPSRDWFQGVWPAESPAPTTARLRAAFAGVGRRLADAAPELDDPTRRRLVEAGAPGAAGWRLRDFARAALLARALDVLPPESHPAVVRELFRRGDYREQAAVLRALPLLPEPARFLDLAVEACRTNVLDVFEAIACDNPYPAAHFPGANFNQMVVKALFVGAPLARVRGLADRDTPELRRMVGDFASERRAAGRPVPEDAGLVLRS
ncbi:MAG TPA: EboA domain-containing protein [Geminicoccaceae bacterium]|nr:EboA domain-containing protein [Geminicoccaceae bacterium]